VTANLPGEGAAWDCAAYGPEAAEAGALCFVSGELHKRVCADLDECRRVVAAERRRVFRRINELAASGDETGIYLAGEFTGPEQLLGGFEGDDDQEAGR
jgi:hypothetical protein